MAARPFPFYASLPIIRLTGRSAANLAELLTVLRTANDRMIFYLTYDYHREYPWLEPRYPSRLAYWIAEVLRERALGERLAIMDLRAFGDLGEVRKQLIASVEDYLAVASSAGREVPPGLELSVCEADSHVLPTGRAAASLAELRAALAAADIDCLFYHFIEARWPAARPDRDLIAWLADTGHPGLADRLNALHPFVYPLEDVRARALRILDREAFAGRVGRRLAAYPVETPVKAVLERLPIFHEARDVLNDLLRTRRRDNHSPS